MEGDHQHKIMDRPFKPKYGTVSQVLFRHCAKCPCFSNDDLAGHEDANKSTCASHILVDFFCRHDYDVKLYSEMFYGEVINTTKNHLFFLSLNLSVFRE